MKNNFIRLVLLFLFYSTAFAQTAKVSVVKGDEGMKLVVDGQDFMINRSEERFSRNAETVQ